MRKIFIILIAFIAVVTFIQAYDNARNTGTAAASIETISDPADITP